MKIPIQMIANNRKNALGNPSYRIIVCSSLRKKSRDLYTYIGEKIWTNPCLPWSKGRGRSRAQRLKWKGQTCPQDLSQRLIFPEFLPTLVGSLFMVWNSGCKCSSLDRACKAKIEGRKGLSEIKASSLGIWQLGDSSWDNGSLCLVWIEECHISQHWSCNRG
jgi:hypothetical protein